MTWFAPFVTNNLFFPALVLSRRCWLGLEVGGKMFEGWFVLLNFLLMAFLACLALEEEASCFIKSYHFVS